MIMSLVLLTACIVLNLHSLYSTFHVYTFVRTCTFACCILDVFSNVKRPIVLRFIKPPHTAVASTLGPGWWLQCVNLPTCCQVFVWGRFYSCLESWGDRHFSRLL